MGLPAFYAGSHSAGSNNRWEGLDDHPEPRDFPDPPWADLQALQWAEDNLPAGESVVVNSFLWGYNKMAGSDGGYWAAPLAGHPSVPPPVLHSLSNPLQIQRQADQLSREIFDKSSSPGELAAVMAANHLRYIIIGAKSGVLSPKSLVESGLFSILFQKDGCWVFVLK